MLRETSQIIQEAGERVPVSATSQIETAAYIETMAVELKGIAERSGLVVQAYLLSMVALSARERIEHESTREIA